MTAALSLALALAASAQSPMPSAPPDAQGVAPPAASTQTAVAASTETAAAAVVASTAGVHIAGAVKPKLTRPIHATLHAEAKDWEPLSLRAGGDPFAAETKVVFKQEKVKGRYKGAPSKAKATARVHKAGEARWLIVSVWPKSLERRRLHLEVRFRIAEGFVEDAKAYLVYVVDRRPIAWVGLDSEELRELGVGFEEESPASGLILLAALDPRPSRGALNAGSLKLATFADKDAGLTDASWSVKGLK